SRNAHRNTNPVEIRRTARALAAVEVIMEPPSWANCGCAEVAWLVLVAVWVMGGLLYRSKDTLLHRLIDPLLDAIDTCIQEHTTPARTPRGLLDAYLPVLLAHR